MSTTDQHRTTLSSRKFVVSVTAGAVAIAATAAVFLAANRPSTAAGAVVGGGLVLVLMVVSRLRAVRRAAGAGPASRIGAGVGDERDRGILTTALATTGYASFLTLGGASIAVLLGASAVTVITVALFAQIGVLAVAFGVASRRG
jgi:hypothetical protein